MNELDRQLQRLFAAAKPARRSWIEAKAPVSAGFAGRVMSRFQPGLAADNKAANWTSLSQWGLGLACALLVLNLTIHRGLFSQEWSPAIAAAEQVTEFVSLP